MEDNITNPVPSVTLETMEKKTYIYALIDPRDNHIRYIGKADDPIYRTFFQKHHKGSHINEAKYSKSNTYNLNLKIPIFKIIQEIQKKEYFSRNLIYEYVGELNGRKK
jgi:hypothetical protein